MSTSPQASAFDLIFLDFDGVVVQSNEIKNRAFEQIFAQAPAHHEALMSYHRAHNATPRREKFRYAVHEILRAAEGDALVNSWVSQFEVLTREAVIACPFVPGAHEFLSQASKSLPLYLVSATPQDDLDLIIDRRHLRTFFTGIHGADQFGKVPKSHVMLKILNERQTKSERCLFLGDSPEDLTAAQEARVTFLGIGSVFQRRNESDVESVGDLKDALTWLLERQTV